MELDIQQIAGNADLIKDTDAETGAAHIIIKCEKKIRDLIKKNLSLDGKRFELRTEACVLQLAYTNNKLLSLSNSRTQILAHQVESTHRIINSINQRFLVADEVGLGKTIEAGLVIKELIFRHGYGRILVACPASLIMQWQNELRSKFNEDFAIIDRQKLKRYRGKEKNNNPWEACGKAICSLDFIKSKSNIEELKTAGWDIIIIDEAHRLRRDSLNSTLAYNAAEVLAKNTKVFLLLSATPFRGKLEELYYLIKLVDRNLLGPFQTFYNAYCIGDPSLAPLQEKLSSVIIRRTKKEVGGFTKRHAKTVRFELLPEERTLYDATTRYVIEEFNKAMQTENRAVGFVMTVFQKLLDSSTFALLSALRKRRYNLNAIIDRPDNKAAMNQLIEKKLNIDLNDIDDDADFDEIIESTIRKTIDEIKEEITVLDSLISIGSSITRNMKGEKLRELLVKLKKNKCRKVVIFTQFRTTQDYLKDLLADFKVELFHGSLDRDEKETAIQNFKDDAEILVSTEAGGEGRNLQFCNVLVNYDLPWSPLKIEQRIGRIHRFGQESDVYIYNFSTKDTVAERVLQVLVNKLKLFEESIGVPDILLGQIEDGINLSSIFMDMAAGRKSVKMIYEELDEKLEGARESYEKIGDLTVTKTMDFNYDEYYRVTLQERNYSNRRIESFVNALREQDAEVDRLLGPKHAVSGLYRIKMLPDGQRPDKKNGTFESDRALNNESVEFLAFGNPVVDHFIKSCRNENFGGLTGVRVIKYHKEFIGMILYYVVTFRSASEHQELIPVFAVPDSSLGEDELREIENLSIEEPAGLNYKNDKYMMKCYKIASMAGKYFNIGRERVMMKIDSRIIEIGADLGKSITPEIEKISDSYGKKIKEYEEQLSRQTCSMKWFNKDMRSAITRTKNNIYTAKEEMENTLARYSSYRDIQYSIELLNAGILISPS